MKLLSLITICGISSALLVGCGGSDSGSSSLTVDSSSKTRNLTPASVSSTEHAVVTGINSLGFDLLGDASENAAVAPFSASLSLARLRAGAAGQTRTAISDFMHLTGLSDVDSTFNALDLSINSRIGSLALGGHASLASAGAWGQSRYGYLLTYLDTLAGNYGLWPLRIDFAGNNVTASQAVNDWAFVASGLSASVSTSQDTRLVLGDAVRFNAAWESPFEPALTASGWFQASTFDFVQVPFLRKTASFQQARGDGYVAVELPLNGGQRFLAIMPDEGRYQEIRDVLTAERLDQIIAALTPTMVDLALPKFTINYSITLALGNTVGRDEADFSGIDGTMDLFVSSTQHGSRLAVAEAGLQAASVTLLALEDAHPETWTDPNSLEFGSIFTSGSIDLALAPPDLVVLGRPFLFAVRDSVSGTILFMGQVLDPSL